MEQYSQQATTAEYIPPQLSASSITPLQQQQQQQQQQASLPSFNTFNNLQLQQQQQQQPQQHQQQPQHQQQQQQQQNINAINFTNNYNPLPTAPQTPSTSAPNTPGSTGNGTFQLQPLNTSVPLRAPFQASHNYQALPGYNANSILQNPMVAMTQNQSISSVPTLAAAPRTGHVPIMPHPRGMHGQLNHNMHWPSGTNQLPQETEQPLHVVGSQGRRGVLPSAPGRPAIATGPGAAKNTVIPAKDADGKFPCPHCDKTYLHAKHLKRHLLRHTGDRPYMCVLCNDTFSRSDILKRHFSKCATRRGNPTGITHLTHAHAHLAGRGRGKTASARPAPPSHARSGSSDQGSTNNYPFGVVPGSPAKHSDQSSHDVSRANSIKMEGPPLDRTGMNAPTPPNGSTRNSFDASAYGGVVPTSMPPGMTSHGYGMSNGSVPQYASMGYNFQTNNTMQSSANDLTALSNRNMPLWNGAATQWSAGPGYYQTGAQHGFTSSYNLNLGQNQVQNQMAIKSEAPSTHSNDQIYDNMFPVTRPTNTSSSHSTWSTTGDPMLSVVERLMTFSAPAETTLTQIAHLFLTLDNITHFLENFRHFQGHFPLIHMPSFDPLEASNSLLLAMVCVGAVYSARVSPSQVREFMETCKSAIEKDSPVHLASSNLTEQGNANSSRFATKDLENMQASYLMQILFIWHGSPVQRERARRKFPAIIKLTKDMGLCRPSSTSDLFSVLHQPNVNPQNMNNANFQWHIWVQQERRSRLFYAIYLLDAVMCMYFNISPQLDGFSVDLPLPADDAAWEAKTASECADALGLRGDTVAQSVNPQGTRRSKQPEMHTALKNLMAPGSTFEPGSTNLYSKFVLIHAIQMQLWTVQSSLAQGGQTCILSRVSTPVSQQSATIEKEVDSPVSLRLVEAALSKWKQVWDIDICQQYPPSCTTPKPHGFCRDGAHFFYLARYLLQNKVDWQMAPDARFSHIMAVLKYVKQWAVSDAARRSEDLGSVNDIDQDYGSRDLTLNMAQLFAPQADLKSVY